MASFRFSYQRLKKLPTSKEEDEELEEEEQKHISSVIEREAAERVTTVAVKRTSWLRLRRRRRPAVRVLGLRRLLRRKAKVVKGAVRRVLKTLREGKPYIGELFAGNYMFMQVSPSPTPLKLMNSNSFLPKGAVMGPPVSSSRFDEHQRGVV